MARLIFTLFLTSFLQVPLASAAKSGGIVDSPTSIRPLLIGSPVPEARIRLPDGKEADLKKLLSAKPTVLIYYRGSWCPYCMKHLKEMSKAAAEFEALGYQVVAISPDRPEIAAKSAKNLGSGIQVLSDSDLVAAQAFGLAFKVDPAMQTKLKQYGIDIQKASGRDHLSLPVPAVYLIDSEGKVSFSYANPDYTQRMGKEVIRAVAKGQKD